MKTYRTIQFLKQFITFILTCSLFICLGVKGSSILNTDSDSNSNKSHEQKTSYISSLSADYKVDKSVQLFRYFPLPSESHLKLKCNFGFNSRKSLNTIEWLKYDTEDAKLLKIFPGAKSNTSELKFLFTNENEFTSAQAAYVCKHKSPNINQSIFNTEFIQTINSNELIKFQSSLSLIHFDLKYSVIKLTSQQAVIEIESLDANYFSDNVKFKLIYSLVNLKTSESVLRGKLDIKRSKESPSTASYLILEGLSPSQEYTLQIYLKSSLNPLQPSIIDNKRNYVFFIAAKNLTTPESVLLKDTKKLQSAFQIIRKKLSNSNKDYIEDDYDYEDDYDDSYDYESSDLNKNDQTIVNCQTDLIDANNQFVTLNYFPSNVKQLVKSIYKSGYFDNKTKLNDLIGSLHNYKDFFQLHNIRNDEASSLDYSTYYDCSRQVSSENFKTLTKPLCLFNLANIWTSTNEESNLDDEVFSVQTSLNTNQNDSVIYIASTCQNKRKLITLNNNFLSHNPLNVNEDNDSLKKSDLVVNSESRERILTSKKATNLSSISVPITTSTLKSITTSREKFQQLISNSKIYQLKSPNISSCLILNENELQFKIEHLDTNLKYVTHTKPVLVYYIEFEPTDLRANNLIFTHHDSSLADESIQQTKKFFIKKQNDIQVVKINFVRGNYHIPLVEEEVQMSSSNSIGINIQDHIRSKRSNSKSKAEPLVISQTITLLDPKPAVFKIKIKLFSESSSHSSNFTQISVTCRHIYNDTQVFETKTSNYYGRYTKIALALTLLFTLIIIFSGFLICAIMKNKFGLSPEYFLNLKNSILLKSSNRSNSNNNLNSIHSSVLNLKKQSKQPQNGINSYQQQYQLQFRLNKLTNDCTNDANTGSILSNNYSYTSNTHGSMVNIQNPLFSLNYEDLDSIGIDLFEIYVQKMHVDGDFGFVQLYEEITNAVRAYMFSADVSLMEVNKCKNRYSNILAYDHSRVKLSCDDKDESSGYINGNYVNGYQKPNGYIATQGPMPNTFGDFWRMIWEKNCSIVCMITNVLEKGRVKCDQYWPDEGSKAYGNFQVTHLHTITLAFYTKRIFTIKFKNAKKRCNTERLVYQFHFTDWPDHGVPYYIMPVLAFIKQSSRANPELGGPIVVHCSAGVGRTGTYIVIDAMMKQIMDKCTINVHNFLKHIRHQRNYLVQTEEQFIFIYDVLLESLKSGETELNEANYKQFLTSLNQVISENDGIKFIDRQFELIIDFKPSEWQISFSQLPYNIDKNRTPNILPVNSSRAILSRKPGVEGSDYINASYLHGCSRQDEFLVTQYPMSHTKLAFWQMVWDNNSNQIVVLNSDETESCESYWLPAGEAMKCESFTVILRDENFDIDFVIRDFLLQSIDEDYEFNCRMISTCYWPESCEPIKSSFDLINKVRSFREKSIESQIMAPSAGSSLNAPPIIIHDLNGGFRAGAFCALYTFQDLIKLENTVNVYEIAKMYHLKRPGIWQNVSNITFLYNAVECLFDVLRTSIKNYKPGNKNISNSSSAVLITKNSSLTYTGNSKQNPQTFTLPNAARNYQDIQKSRNISNEALIGSRLYNFHSQIQKDRNVENNTGESLIDPSITIPLTDANLGKGGQGKTSFSISGIPRMLPSFLSKHSSSNNTDVPGEMSNFRRSFMKSFDFHRRSSDTKSSSTRSSFSIGRNSRASKFMSSVMIKSSSFKRALFPRSTQLSSNLPESHEDSGHLHLQKSNENPPLMITLASGSEISASSDNSGAANESSLNSKSALIQPQTSSSVSPDSAAVKLPDLPETTIILNNNKATAQSNIENLSSII